MKTAILIMLLLAVSCGCVSEEEPIIPPTASAIEASIDKGIDFLHQNQLEYGEFKTYECNEPEMRNCIFGSSPFITSFVLYSIKDVENEKVTAMTTKGLDFLLSEQGADGTWNYRTTRNPKFTEDGQDTDDTATVSFILKYYNVSYKDNIEILNSTRNSDGLFLTWFPGSKNQNNVDCVVNANVLLYLGENDPKVCAYLNKAIKNNEKCSVYYPNRLALFYMVSRAYKNNITCFEESKNKIIESTTNNQKADGSFGTELDTALAINTLQNFGYEGVRVDKGVNKMLKTQGQDGSWDKAPFYISPHYGSEELTTALTIEALENYLK
jgi:hypothetical protein